MNTSRNGKSTLTGRMWLILVLLLLMFGMTFVISTMVITTRAEHDYEMRESQTAINSVVGGIEANFETYEDISRLIMLDDGVVKYLRAEEPTAFQSNNARDGIMSVLNVCQSIDSVYIFKNSGKYISTGHGEYIIDYERMQSAEWKKVIEKERGGAVVLLNANNAVFKSNGAPIITIARAIYDIYTQEQTGILLMNITENLFVRIVQAKSVPNVCITTTEGRILAGDRTLHESFDEFFVSDEIVYRTVTHENERMTVSGKKTYDMPFVVLCSTSSNTGVVPKEIFYALFLLLISFIAAITIFGIFITRNITRPIRQLADSMEQTKSSGWLKKLDVDMPKNEMGMLADSYNSMIEYINDVFNRLLENEKTVQKAEMRVLHEQIKPHFLYNSLETISFMALNAGAEDVHSALETLGSFYRNFLSKGDREIPLKREICIIRDYLELQKLRYGDIINDEYDIAADTVDCMIPKLILQPLVENSIYHGIRQKGEAGTIHISSCLKDDGVHIIVRDDGVGMTQEHIDELLCAENRESDTEALSGFGLKGTIERIRCYCDKDDLVDIRSEQGEYTEIEITIPQGK